MPTARPSMPPSNPVRVSGSDQSICKPALGAGHLLPPEYKEVSSLLTIHYCNLHNILGVTEVACKRAAGCVKLSRSSAILPVCGQRIAIPGSFDRRICAWGRLKGRQ